MSEKRVGFFRRCFCGPVRTVSGETRWTFGDEIWLFPQVKSSRPGNGRRERWRRSTHAKARPSYVGVEEIYINLLRILAATHVQSREPRRHTSSSTSPPTFNNDNDNNAYSKYPHGRTVRRRSRHGVSLRVVAFSFTRRLWRIFRGTTHDVRARVVHAHVCARVKYVFLRTRLFRFSSLPLFTSSTDRSHQAAHPSYSPRPMDRHRGGRPIDRPVLLAARARLSPD